MLPEDQLFSDLAREPATYRIDDPRGVLGVQKGQNTVVYG